MTVFCFVFFFTLFFFFFNGHYTLGSVTVTDNSA